MLQLDHRPCSPGFTTAVPLQSAVATIQESCADDRVQPGFCVGGILLSVFETSLLKGFISTCIITLCRLVFLLEVDYSDLTYNSVKAFIFTTLEPSLAVTLACVPLLRPLLNRCRYSKTGTARFASATGRSSGARQCNRQDDSFDPLDDASDIQLRDSCQKGLETPPEPAESETPRRYLKKDRAQFKVV